MVAKGRTEAGPYGLAADVGGTNVRLALTPLHGACTHLLNVEVFRTSAFSSLQDCIEAYLGRHGDQPRPTAAVLGVASPVAGDAVRLTNHGWSFSTCALATALGMDDLLVLNDFAAAAASLPMLGPDDWAPLSGPPWPTALPARVAVVGPGTGLGVAMFNDGRTVVPTEAGHMGFSPVDAQEVEIYRRLLVHLPRVSAETLLSGPGLERLHEVLAEMEGAEPRGWSAARIVENASGDRLAAQAVERFSLIFGSVTGDLALAQGAQAVAVAGGIAMRILDHLKSPAVRQRFEAKGAGSELLRTATVAVISHPQPGLLGAAGLLRSRAREVYE